MPDSNDRDCDGHAAENHAPRTPGLPVERAFVVQFTDDTDPGLSSCSGRVEHIESGRRGRFRGVDDLLSFVRETLGRSVGSGRNG